MMPTKKADSAKFTIHDGYTSRRRKLLKALTAGGGAVATAKLLPNSWVKPVVDTVVLPAHAEATGPTGPTGPTLTLTCSANVNNLIVTPGGGNNAAYDTGDENFSAIQAVIDLAEGDPPVQNVSLQINAVLQDTDISGVSFPINEVVAAAAGTGIASFSGVNFGLADFSADPGNIGPTSYTMTFTTAGAAPCVINFDMAQSMISDRNRKANFDRVDRHAVLQQVAKLPIETWNYKDQPESVRHIGPMAQDFHSVFGVGDDDRHINMVDASGVAMASIQALYEENQHRRHEIESLGGELAEIKDLNLQILQKIERLGA